jgi:DNA-binding transcriptional ArsR family regulator
MSDWIVSPEELQEGDYADMDDLNERVRRQWVADTTPDERVRSIIRRTYEAQSVATIAERSLTTEATAGKHLDILAKGGFVEEMDVGDGVRYRRAPDSLVDERVQQIRESVDAETLAERVEELRETVREYEEQIGGESYCHSGELTECKTALRNLRFVEEVFESAEE